MAYFRHYRTAQIYRSHKRVMPYTSEEIGRNISGGAYLETRILPKESGLLNIPHEPNCKFMWRYNYCGVDVEI